MWCNRWAGKTSAHLQGLAVAQSNHCSSLESWEGPLGQSQQERASRERVRLHMLACLVVGSSRQGASIACIEDLDNVAYLSLTL